MASPMLMEVPAQIQPAERYPAFLKQRMDEFYLQRLAQDWRGRHILRGRLPDNNSVQLLSNDYLGIAGHERIRKAKLDTLQAGDEDMLMSGVFMNPEASQRQLEQRFAEFTGFGGAILSQSGYAANVGLLQAIAGPGVPVYIDRIAHASLWEGIQSAGAEARPFRHNDPDHLLRQIRRYGPGVICVDSVYSTIGTLCPIEEIGSIARLHGCIYVVDESHSLGTHGADGSGLVKALGLHDCVDFVTASLAKAFVGRAGLIACAKDFVDYFWVTARPAIFSSCLLDHEIAGMSATLDVVIEEGWRREAVRRNSDYLRQGLDELGFNVSASQSQIISLEAGSEYNTLLLREALEAENIFGSVFCAPATPKNRALVRMSINAGMTVQQLDQVLAGCERVRNTLDIGQWPSTRRKMDAVA